MTAPDCPCHDLLAVLALVEPEVIPEAPVLPLGIDTAGGAAWGSTVVDFRAPFFAALFFPPGNATAALLSSFVAYAAGFLIRPFGALVFGRIGDLVGRIGQVVRHGQPPATAGMTATT